ncbi:MAG TPA: hypothetical protein VFX86_03365 [Candidatus Saccharimonadales bacterium]|nr:hypothetical protein [Candidatus Saccharimonadales bacterium]
MKSTKDSRTGISFVQFYLRLIGCITFGLGLLLLFWTDWAGELLFNRVSLPAEFFIRITGSTLIGYSVLNMLASLHRNRHLQEFAVWGNLSTLMIASIITIGYYNRFDSLGWLLVTQHVFFGAGFIVCVLMLKRSDS